MKRLDEKIIKIISKPHVASFATVSAAGVPWVRYVTAMGDHDMNIRFATHVDSRKVTHIQGNPHVHLTYGCSGEKGRKDYLQIQGRATFSVKESDRHAFWDKSLCEHFDGPDDPLYGVVIVEAKRIEYGSEEGAVWVSGESDTLV
jgi:general stress protein 26